MKLKKVMALLLAAAISVSAVQVAVPEMVYAAEQAAASESVYDQLKASFAESLKESVAAEIQGKTSAQILSLGKAYETGNGVTLWYAKAMALYEAARDAAADGSKDKENAQAAIDALEAFKNEKNAEGVQGFVFTYYREGVTASQSNDYAKTYCVYYDDAFFFEEEENRGIGGLGDLLRDGVDGVVNQDIPTAIAVYQYCAETLGKGNGYTSLGLLYSAKDGTYPGIKHSDEKAMNYFLKSFDTNYCSSTDFKGPRYAGNLYDSGYYLDNGAYVAPDYAKAEACYLVAVAGNERTFDGTAAVYLGQYYETGKTDAQGKVVVEQNMEKAFTYFTKALSDRNVHSTMIGIPHAIITLAHCYEDGNGTAVDLDKAKEYYEKAITAAQENLDLVNTASEDAEMLEIKADAEAGLARLASEATVDTAAVSGTYTCGQMTITLGSKGDCTIAQGNTKVNGRFSYEQVTNKWIGKTTTTVTFSTAVVNALKSAGCMPSYWTGEGTLAGKAFNPTYDLTDNEVKYTASTAADATSPTGYNTIFTVADAGYENVYLYGEWDSCSTKLTNPSDPSSYSDATYSPYQWENGNFYNDSSAIEMTKNDAGNWVAVVPLASGQIKVKAVANLADADDASAINLTDDSMVYGQYDPQKQSESYDWSITYYDKAIAGTTDINVSFNCAEDGHAINLAVYLPKNYDPNKTYPVIYYVPGGATTYAKVFEGNKTNSILDHLIASGDLEETVFVGIERTDNPYLVDEILPYVESHYSVATDAAHRALYAVSMGSAASTTIWLDENTTNTFGYYGFFSGADKATFDTNTYGELDAAYIEKLSAAKIMIGGGTLDFNMFDGDNNSASITQLDAWMNNYGIQHTMTIVGGAHNGVTWQPLEEEFFRNLW